MGDRKYSMVERIQVVDLTVNHTLTIYNESESRWEQWGVQGIIANGEGILVDLRKYTDDDHELIDEGWKEFHFEAMFDNYIG